MKLGQLEEFVKSSLESDSSGHDWWHIDRVRKLAMRLWNKEGGNSIVIECAALLHDCFDWKFNSESQVKKIKLEVEELLRLTGVTDSDIFHIFNIIENVSFKGAGVKDNLDVSVETKIVRDADRLDALGAIGVARTFAYGGSKGQLMHDPNIQIELHQDFKAYKEKKSTSINHFYEKLFLLKDRLMTESAKKVAEKRHLFMKEFVDQFLSEWEGEV